MLTLDEVDERLEAVFATRYQHDLNAIVDDLPATAPAEKRRGARSARDSVAAIYSAVVDLVLAVYRSARLHPRITITVTFAVIAALSVAVVMGWWTESHEASDVYKIAGR